MINENEIRHEAHIISEAKLKLNIKSTPTQDWAEAKESLKLRETLRIFTPIRHGRRYLG